MNAVAAANLLAWAVQAVVVVVVAAPLPRLLGVWSPKARIAIWRALLVACLLLPVLQPRVVKPTPIPAQVATEAATTVTPAVGRAPAVGQPAPAGRVLAPTPSRWWWSPAVLAAVLAAGGLLRVGWLGLGLVTLARLRRSARPLEPRPASIDRAVSMTGVDAEFLVSAEASRPVACGLRRPVVLVPRDFDEFPEDEQAAMACHELLHVGRGDWTWNLADELTRAVFWFHPAVLWLVDQIHLAREQVVDREVVRRLGTKQPYLQALLRMAKPAPRMVLTPASPFLKRAHLTQRVALLVKEASMSKVRLACSILIMAVVVFIGGRLAVSALPLQQTGAPLPAATEPDVNLVPPVATTAAATAADPAPAAALDAALPPQQSRPGPPPPAVNAPWHPEVLRIGGTIKPPTRTVDVKAVYPAEAQAARVQGVVICELLVGTDGRVEDARILRSIPLLDQAALDAVRQWEFSPTLENGNPVPVVMTVTVNFVLDGSGSRGHLEAAAAAAWHPEVLRVGGDIRPPTRTVDVKAVYPAEAQAARVQGVVICQILVGTDGKVEDARILRSIPLLDQAALDAVRQWEFSPTLENGNPVPVVMTVTVNFVLD